MDFKKYKEMLPSSLEQFLDSLEISFDEAMGVKKIDSFFTKK
ncbi:MAG TPA: hypothetical protein VKK79_23065 [Candidatus Lokiarchaeia archaeon]|nr:hypothetical protein [Candidatus Lokiarchaeia archaeon]